MKQRDLKKTTESDDWPREICSLELLFGQLHSTGSVSGHEEITLLQHQEWRLCFPGPTVRRYPTSRVRECGGTPHPRAKEKPQQDGRRGEFVFKIKSHSLQRCSEGSNKPWVHQDPGTLQRLRQNCLSISCGGTGSYTAVGCYRDRGSGCSRLGYGVSPLRGGHH